LEDGNGGDTGPGEGEHNAPEDTKFASPIDAAGIDEFGGQRFEK
jgi:hypothetical protein